MQISSFLFLKQLVKLQRERKFETGKQRKFQEIQVQFLFFYRQQLFRFDKHLEILRKCEKLKQKEAILASQASAIIKFDLSNCKTLAETFSMSPVVIYFPKNHYLIEAVNEKLRLLKAAGLIDFFIRSYTRSKLKANKNSSKIPKIMTLFDLSGGFKVWLFGLSLALLTLGVEIFVKFVQKLKNKKQRT